MHSVNHSEIAHIHSIDFKLHGFTTTSIPTDVTFESGGAYALENYDFDKGNPDHKKDTKVMTIENSSILDSVPRDPLQASQYFIEGLRGQLDTGAKVTCTNQRHLLHRYKPYNSIRKCPVNLTAAIDGSKVSTIPEGSGYLRIPVPNNNGYIDVFCYYSPRLSSTLISENGIFGGTTPAKKFTGQSIHKFFTSEHNLDGNLTLICHHRYSHSQDIVMHGVIKDGQCYTHPFILPDMPDDSPYANCATSSTYALKADPTFKEECDRASETAINNYRTDLWREINTIKDQSQSSPWGSFIPFRAMIEESIPINAIKARTAKLLWHQRLGHPCDEYLYNAHKFIDGVPKFSRQSSVIDQCPTCIQSKQTKEAPGKHTTRTATQPYQGLSIDFSFSGIKSRNSDRRQDYEGINGETAWILVSDHFTGMKHGDTRISKAAPLHWLEHFFSQYNPKCRHKYVYLDQGGELFNNPDIKNLFQKYGYDILPTGADSSHQNGPVERGHRTLANSMRALLSGANLPIKFWPYAFYHALRLSNAFPERGHTESPLMKATAKREDLSNFRTFGCRVWVRPPGRRSAKLINNSRKGIFLGFVPYTTRNILWYDIDTTRVKIASHARFDEGMNDLPFDDLPPNVLHLQRTDDGIPLPAEHQEVDSSTFDFNITPFANLLHHQLIVDPKSTDQSFGLVFRDDDILRRAYITDIKPNSPASRLYSSLKATKRKLIGAYIVSINHDRVFTAADTEASLQLLHNQGVESIPITLAAESKLSAKQLRQHSNEYGLFAPSTKWDNPTEDTIEEDEPFLDRTPIHQITRIKNKYSRLTKNAIAQHKNTEALHAKIQQQLAPIEDDMDVVVPSLDLSSFKAIMNLHRPENAELMQQEDPSDELITLAINAINSKATTPEEQALGHFTRRKLRSLSTWNEWETGERKQLNQFEELQMFGEPIIPPNDPNAIILRPHWQYHIKRDGTRRARQCCNGSKYAAPLLHAIAMTYSSCVEHPIQRLFFAIAANLNLKVFGGDAKDAYGHSPGPEIPTYISIDDQYADWYKYKHGHDIDRRKVLPVLRALQGHPESGRLWESHINKILQGPKLKFKSTTHDRTIYTTQYRGEKVYLLRQVDDFALACTKQSIADEIYDIIGKDLQLPKEDTIPFTKLGIITDFNGIDVEQSKDYIQLSAANYIDRIMTSHGWETDSSMKPHSKPNAPLSTEVLHQLHKHNGPLEGTKEHSKLEEKNGFSYRTLLGEMMFAYVSCRPDIGYAITLMSKYGSNPSDFHYKCLKNIARYLRTTRTWGIIFSRSSPAMDLPESEVENTMNTTDDLPNYPEDISQGKLICFVDAAYGNDPKRRRSTTGYAFTYSGGAIVYRSKAQSITAQSSTEAEFIAAVTAAKTARYLRSVLTELGFSQEEPTHIYEDNASTIEIVNAQKPTERSRHMEIRYFAIQDWKEAGDIKLLHIPGIINPADDLTKPLGWVLHARHARYIMGHHYHTRPNTL